MGLYDTLSVHSKHVIHGDFHPVGCIPGSTYQSPDFVFLQGNVLIDSDHNARLTDFGFSHTLSPQNDLTYPSTNAARPGAAMWVAPELLYPQLFPDLMVGAKTEPNLHVDIYSLGSIILFVRRPW